MRELRYVGPGADPDHVIVETLDDAERFSLPVAAVLAQSTQTDLLGAPAPTVAAPPPEPPAEPEGEPMTTAPAVELSPRDIQVRVRAGESPEELAAQSGDDIGKIMRFAGPVLAERARITDEARRGRARRNNADSQSVTFGPAVDERFAAHQVALADVRWDAYRRGDGTWIVTATWPEAETTQQADFSFNLTTRTVTPLDDHAVELLSDRPIRPARPAGEGRPTLTVAPPPAPDVVAFPAQPDAYTSPLPRDDVFDQEAFDASPTADAPVPVPPAPVRPAAKAVRVVPAPVPEPAVEPAAEPELPLDLPPAAAPPVETPPAPAASASEPDVEQDEPAEDEKPKVTNLGVAHRPAKHRSTKPAMPSWDDILMGVRRKTD